MDYKTFYIQPRADLNLQTKNRYIIRSTIQPVIINNKRYCAWCGKVEIGTKKNKKYCSKLCLFSSFVYCTPHHKVTKKWLLACQNFKCNLCGFDYNDYVFLNKGFYLFECFKVKLMWSKIPLNRYPELDHINEIQHGGNGVGIENYQMLCKQCHKEKTKNNRKRSK